MALTQYQFLDPVIDDKDAVLAIRATALALYAEGKTLMEWSGEGTSGKRQWVADIEQILAETRYFLKQYDPATYGYVVRSAKQFRV